MPRSKRPSVSSDGGYASHAMVEAGRNGEAYLPGAHPKLRETRCDGQRRAGGWLHPGTSGINSVE